MSTISLFVNTLLSSPIEIPFTTRYVFVSPHDLGLLNIQKVSAIVRDGETSLTFDVDASNSSSLTGSIVLDTTLSLEFIINGMSKKKKE